MYSEEIDQLLKSRNYILDPDTYMEICIHSPQIDHIKYTPFEHYFQMWTKDGYFWKFSLMH